MLRKLFIASPFVAIIFLFIFQTGVTSCTKEKTIVDTVTKVMVDTVVKVRVDTLQEKDTILTAAMLTANSWKPSVVRGIINNTYIIYVRGGSGNTQSFDIEYITFNPDGTGIYHDGVGVATTFAWHFVDATTLIWVWNGPYGVIPITWENIKYDDGAIRYTEFYNENGYNVLASNVRVPK
jgi:hypothetical protein